MKKILAALLLAAPLAAHAERLPMQRDVDHCALAAVDRGAGLGLQGKLRLELLTNRQGKVFAAFVSAEHGIDYRPLERCLTNQAVLWVFPEAAIDYKRPYPVSFVSGGAEAGGTSRQLGSHTGATPPSVFMPDINDPPPPEPVDLAVARATLEIAEWASAAERGMAYLEVQSYAEAIPLLKQAVNDPKGPDPMGLRGLSRALAESGGDLKEAADAAQKLISLNPKAEAGHEALMRVCLAAHQDLCAFEQFQLANKSTEPDRAQRSRILHDELLAPAQEAAKRLREGKTQQVAQGGAAPADPCAAEQGDDKQALCVVKRCLDAGSEQYAKELSEQNHLAYAAGEWRVKAVGGGKLLVTREIAVPAKQGDAAPPPRHDALWLVKLGDQLVMQPSNSEARQITLTHNACSARVSAGN